MCHLVTLLRPPQRVTYYLNSPFSSTKKIEIKEIFFLGFSLLTSIRYTKSIQLTVAITETHILKLNRAFFNLKSTSLW